MTTEAKEHNESVEAMGMDRSRGNHHPRIFVSVGMIRFTAIAVALKAATITATVLLVIGSSLSQFIQAIIIAAVSAVITGVFTVIAAVFAVRLTRPIHEDLRDVKHKIGADRRESDTQE